MLSYSILKLFKESGIDHRQLNVSEHFTHWKMSNTFNSVHHF